MKRNHQKHFLEAIVLLFCVLLFCQRLTGGVWHGILGILLILAAARHIFRQTAAKKDCACPVKAADLILTALLALLLVTGSLLHPLHGILLLKLLHKLSAVFFVLALIVHMLQHR